MADSAHELFTRRSDLLRWWKGPLLYVVIESTIIAFVSMFVEAIDVSSPRF
jgi:hypothetical protein